MAKQLWFTSPGAAIGRSNNDAMLNGTASWWTAEKLSEVRGSGASTRTAATVAGATNGLEMQSLAPLPVEWLSDPLSADFTISGTITANLWANETAAANNVAINFVVEKLDGATGALTQIVKSARVIEVATASAVNNFTAAPTSTACKRGDRLRVRVFADDAGTMGAGGTATFTYGAATAAANGDSWIQFTETLTFDTTTAPTGSTYYLTDTDETINPGGATEKKALTTRGAGSVNAVTNTAAGPTAGIQVTASAGGSQLEWYTPPLQAVTLGGRAVFNVQGLESNSAANAIWRGEIAVVANDGSAAVVWATGWAQLASGELGTTDQPKTLFAAGASTALTAGQRLRFRIYVDDIGSSSVAFGTMAAGFTTTVSYNGATAAAAGDTYVILPIAVTEQPTATTWNGSSAANLVDAVVTAGTRETFSSAAAALIDNQVTAGTRETFSASTVPLLAGVTTSGQVVALISGVSAVTETATVTTAGVRERLAATATSETVGVVTSATVAATAASAVTQTTTITTSGLVTANAAATVQLTDTVTTSGTAGAGAQTYFGTATVSLTATATTAGVRDTTGSSTTNLSATVTTLGTRTLVTSSTAASVATVTSAGTRETFSTSATAETVLVTTSSGTGSTGSATVSLTGTVTTSGTRVAVTASTAGLAVNVTTAATITAGSSATAALTDTVTTTGSRTTFSTSTVPLTVAVTTLGAKVKFGDVTVTEHVTVTTDGYRDVLATTTSDLHVQIAADANTIVPLPPGRIDTITIGGITHTIWRGIDGTQQGELSTSERRQPRESGGSLMAEVVSFVGYQPPQRFDATPWTAVRIEEAATLAGAYTSLETIPLSPVDTDPANPAFRSFTTELGTAGGYWYRVIFVDATGDTSQPTTPIQNVAGSTPPPTPYASLAELFRVLKIRTPTVEQQAAANRVLIAAKVEIDSIMGRADALTSAQLQLATQVNLERGEELWQETESPWGAIGLGTETGPVFAPRRSRALAKLVPLQQSWGVG